MALTDKLIAIANAIRAKTGETEQMTLDQMATAIAGIAGGGIEGAACGKFTWDGNYPALCDCSGMDSAPTGFILYCPYLVNLGVGGYHSFIAVKELDVQTSKYVLKALANNTASLNTYESEILYDSTLKAVKVKSETGMKLLNGQAYYWIAL